MLEDGEAPEPVALTGRARAVYGMRELNQNTAGVIAEIRASGRPALVKKHGRFIALIQPLSADDAQVETKALTDGALGRVLAERATDPLPKILSNDEVWDQLKLDRDE